MLLVHATSNHVSNCDMRNCGIKERYQYYCYLILVADTVKDEVLMILIVLLLMNVWECFFVIKNDANYEERGQYVPLPKY